MTSGVSPLGMGWRDDALELRLEVDGLGLARLVWLAAGPADGPGATARDGASQAAGGRGPTGLPLVDVIVSGSGRAWSGRRYVESVVGQRMRYLDHEERTDGPWHELKVGLEDPLSGLRADAVYRVLAGRGALRSWARLTNAGAAPVTIGSVSSFLGTGLEGPGGDLEDMDVLWAENDWLAESRWQRRACATPSLTWTSVPIGPTPGDAGA